jgi:hypothetical protein
MFQNNSFSARALLFFNAYRLFATSARALAHTVSMGERMGRSLPAPTTAILCPDVPYGVGEGGGGEGALAAPIVG